MISPSVKFGYSWHRLDFNKIIDDSVPGFAYDSLDFYYTKNKFFPDFSFGLLFNTKRIYSGLAVDHVKERVINFGKNEQEDLSGKDNLFRKYILQLGYNHRAYNEARFSFNPNILYQYQKNNRSLFISNYFRYSYLLIGFGYEKRIDENIDKAFMGVGFSNSNFTFGVSFDYPLTNLNNSIGTAIETSLKYSF